MVNQPAMLRGREEATVKSRKISDFLDFFQFKFLTAQTANASGTDPNDKLWETMFR
ncbi:MAG: hypothetical protein R3B74_05040 [Nitrospirales bacterium]|nr:hypothetical protein [Nitrospirales bacterium]